MPKVSPEKRKESRERFNQRHPEKEAEYRARSYAKHSEQRRADSRQYYQAHRRERLEWARQYRFEHREEISQYQHQYQQEHHEEILKSARICGYNRRETLKLEVLAHYSNDVYPSCLHCGEYDIDVLCLDHVEGGGNKHRKETGKGGVELCAWLKRNNFPEGFQVLCANCNLREATKARRENRRAD